MHVAYLIAAHHQPEHLQRLVDRLAAPWATCFIHVDAKVDLAPFTARLAPSPRVVYLRGAERVKVNWGGFSQVRATLSLARHALHASPRADRFCLLSGSDFPIRPLEQIRQSLASGAEFMRIDRLLTDRETPEHFARRIQGLHFENRPWLSRLSSGSWNLHGLLAPGLPVYQGSSWWALSAACLRHVLEVAARHTRFVQAQKFAHCPDESFFGSIVKASPFATRISQDFERGTAHASDPVHACHYIDWSRGGPNPKVLTMADRPALLASGALFARKFDADASAALLASLSPG